MTEKHGRLAMVIVAHNHPLPPCHLKLFTPNKTVASGKCMRTLTHTDYPVRCCTKVPKQSWSTYMNLVHAAR